VGHRDDGAGVAGEVALEPGHRQRIEVVRRFVEEQDVGLLDEQPAQRDPAALTAGEHIDDGIRRGTAQSVHGELEPGVELPRPHRLDRILHLCLPVEHRLHLVVVHRLGKAFGELVVLRKQRLGIGCAFLDDLEHRFPRLELGLLFQKTDTVARRPYDLSVACLLDAGHDPEQRRLSSTVETEHADLCAIEKPQ